MKNYSGLRKQIIRSNLIDNFARLKYQPRLFEENDEVIIPALWCHK